MTTIPDDPEFQDFLYASVGPDRHGMTLSLLSALARRDLDPWGEARRLDRLRPESAVLQITQLLRALPGATLEGQDVAALADRLSRLLPGRRSQASDTAGAPTTPGHLGDDVLLDWRLICLYVVFLLVVNWLSAEGPGPATPPSASPTTAASPPAARAASAGAGTSTADIDR